MFLLSRRPWTQLLVLTCLLLFLFADLAHMPLLAVAAGPACPGPSLLV